MYFEKLHMDKKINKNRKIPYFPNNFFNYIYNVSNIKILPFLAMHFYWISDSIKILKIV